MVTAGASSQSLGESWRPTWTGDQSIARLHLLEQSHTVSLAPTAYLETLNTNLSYTKTANEVLTNTSMLPHKKMHDIENKMKSVTDT